MQVEPEQINRNEEITNKSINNNNNNNIHKVAVPVAIVIAVIDMIVFIFMSSFASISYLHGQSCFSTTVCSERTSPGSLRLEHSK